MNAPVDELRSELKNLGYLSSGVERWFALDPFRSTTFWRELSIVLLKTVALVAPFALAPIVAVTAMRNSPMAAVDLLLIGAGWLVVLSLAIFTVLLLVALALRSRAAVGVEHPRVLTLIAALPATLFTALIGIWWRGFEGPAGSVELLVGAGLLAVLFIVASLAFAAALLSFTIFETGRIPVMRHTSSTGIIVIAAAVLVSLIAVPEAIRSDSAPPADTPMQVPVRPTTTRVALLAVDGMSAQEATVFDVAGLATHIVPPSGSPAPPERWATIATGVTEDLHGVHAIEGIRLRTSDRVLQDVSPADVVIRYILPAVRLASREPLPPSVRSRHYVWEIAALRGVPAFAANWWAAGQSPLLVSVPQDVIFTRAAANGADDAGRRVDELALRSIEPSSSVRVAAIYLPGLDILDRSGIDDDATRSAMLESVAATTRDLFAAGWEVVVVGTPSDPEQRAVIITSLEGSPESLADVAPTLLDVLGFPSSAEMKGSSWISTDQYQIATYGSRQTTAAPQPDQEYYESLRSLGYIR